MNYFNYSRREATEVYVGATPMGGTNPIRIQSMTNTPTVDTDACVAQAIRIIDAGGEYVRLTTQGVREAENLKNINIGLRSQGYNTPLIADVHFNPKLCRCRTHFQKVRIYRRRIRQGNTEDTRPLCSVLEYLQRESYGYPNRCKPRIFVRPHHVALRRYARRHGRIVYGVSTHLR